MDASDPGREAAIMDVDFTDGHLLVRLLTGVVCLLLSAFCQDCEMTLRLSGTAGISSTVAATFVGQYFLNLVWSLNPNRFLRTDSVYTIQHIVGSYLRPTLTNVEEQTGSYHG
jgi:hypothetical protein